MRHISPNFQSILVAPKCTMIFDKIFGGQEWKEKLLNMLQNVTLVRGWKPVIWKLLELSNLCLFHHGNGMTSAWISLWAYPISRSIMILFRLLLTGSQKQLILFQYTLAIEPIDTRDLSWPYRMPIWGTQDDYFWSWCSVYCTFFGTTPGSSWIQIDSKHCLSSSDWWSNWESKPNSWRYA